MIMGYDFFGFFLLYIIFLFVFGVVVKKKKSIKFEILIDFCGLMEVDGLVKLMVSIKFDGDFVVRDRVEVYGDVGVYGIFNCRFVIFFFI